MKNLFFILSILTAIVCFTNCENENTKKLKREIEATDSRCPINMGIIGDLLSLKYDEKANEIKAYFSLNGDLLTAEDLKTDEALVIRAIKLSLSQGEARQALNQVINAGASISVTYKDTSTGKSFQAKITLDELKELNETPLTDREIRTMILNNQITMANAKCPYLVEDGMEMISMSDEEENIIYSYRIDEDIYDIYDFMYAQYEIKQSMLDFFDDPSMKRLISIIEPLDKGLVYRYWGDTSGERVDITFSNEELRRAMISSHDTYSGGNPFTISRDIRSLPR